MLTGVSAYVSAPILRKPIRDEGAPAARGQESDAPTAGAAPPSSTPADTVSISGAAKGSQASGAKKQEDARRVRELQAAQQAVVAHEMAHKGAGGPYAGAVSYSYTLGPDGRMYITGGEVAIDLSEGRTPEETIRKARIVERAALAPMDPSPQDRQVAAQAARMEARAAQEAQAESRGKGAGGASPGPGTAQGRPSDIPTISIRA